MQTSPHSFRSASLEQRTQLRCEPGGTWLASMRSSSQSQSS
jgi:hypothetical protein